MSQHLDEAYPLRLWISVASALLGSFQAGYQIAVFNTALDHVTTSGSLYSGIVLTSATILGALLGALTGAPTAHACGPRSAQLLNALLFCIASCLSAWDWWDHRGFLIGRLLAGSCAGAASIFVPIYISDIAPRELRRKLLIKHQVSWNLNNWAGEEVFVSCGIFAAILSGLVYEWGTEGIQLWDYYMPWWRVMVGAGAAPAVLQALCLLSCPESPKWLELSDKDKADDACILLWGSEAILYEDTGETESTETLLTMPQPHASPAASALGRAPFNSRIPVTRPYTGATGYAPPAPPHVTHGPFGAFSSADGPMPRTTAGVPLPLPTGPASRIMSGFPSFASRQPQADGVASSSQRDVQRVSYESTDAVSAWRPPQPSDGLKTALLAAEEEAMLSAEAPASEVSGEPGWWATLMQYEYRWIMMLALGLPILQQASGIAVVLVFSSQIFPDLVWPDEFPTLWGCIAVGCVHLVFTMAAGPLADTLGRRPLMIASYAGMAVCLFTAAVITFFQDMQKPGTLPAPATGADMFPDLRADSAERVLDLTNAILVIVYTAFYSLGAGPVMWRYLDEILPHRIKAQVMTFATIINWACALVVVVNFRPALDGLIGIGGLYMVYGMFSVLAVLLVSILLVESKGRTQAEMQALLLQQRKVRLRELFPGRQPSDIPSLTVLYNSARESYASGGVTSADITAAAAKMAAEAWAKLMHHQEQQRQQEAFKLSSLSQSL